MRTGGGRCGSHGPAGHGRRPRGDAEPESSGSYRAFGGRLQGCPLAGRPSPPLAVGLSCSNGSPIANARTRAAYGRAVGQFLGWCEARGLRLRDVSPLHVAAYIQTHPGSVPTVKQHLAAIRMLGDWLVVN